MSHEIKFDAEGHIILHLRWKRALALLAVIFLATLAYFTPLEGLSQGSRICLSIFVAASGLWVTEIIPPFATAIMVVVLSVFLLGKPGGPLGLGETGLETSYQIFLNPISSPVLVLFFGGFILALAASKHGLDVRLARAFIKPFGTHPKMVLLGVILTTALFSMFMSNTATTAMMITIVGPLFRKLEGREPFKKALVLAVPFAANIGGMGTIIGTPPNAVAASLLEKLGHSVSFGKWMMVAVPIMLCLLVFLWLLLFRAFRPREDHFEVLFPEPMQMTWDLLVVVLTFVVTVTLWLVGPFFGLDTGVVALIPVLVFTVFGILDRDDLKSLDWHILILIAGGMTLGVAMKKSGLSDVLFSNLTMIPVPALGMLLVISVFALFISNFMSNTAAANLILPIGMALATGSPTLNAVSIALACSLAMSLPISTPPNAIAFATEIVETKDLVRYGTIVSIFGIIVTLGFLLLIRSSI